MWTRYKEDTQQKIKQYVSNKFLAQAYQVQIHYLLYLTIKLVKNNLKMWGENVIYQNQIHQEVTKKI
jgi:hypothetical protein